MASTDGTTTPTLLEKAPAPLEAVSLDKSWDPTKLSWQRKAHIVIAGFTCTFNGNMGSSMPSGALDAIAEEFNVSQKIHLTLLNSLYMIGYVLGPLIFGPLSEYIGRRPVMIGTFLGYLVFTLACSGAPTYGALLALRLLCGINAAAPTTVISGLYADILDNPSQRGFALSTYMTITTFGPMIGPIISGYSSPVSWRWPFWAAGLIAAPGLPIVLTIPETFAPVLYNKMIKERIKGGSHAAGCTSTELQPFNVRKIFLRPMTLLVTEPILFSTAIYLALAYSVFYLLFQAYPIVYQDFYGLAPGPAALAYLPVALGVILSMAVFYVFNNYYDKSARAGQHWAQREINRRLPIACIASPCMTISLFWLGWTTFRGISPIVVSLGGILWGVGFQLIFMGMSNYLTDVFRQHSASAQAASSMTRSIGAVVLPLAAPAMYGDLGLHWAPSLLAFIALAMGLIPFAFIRYGDALAKRSRYAQAVDLPKE
ncbi:major facilitator superfamily domain-containing protein [Emericellopsis atlantica]|uniref:Major facilitator superfamily domain-containing protein n=1 Tax=Emericellopsis atlantica TaxID=2614577 RepID=A0A9P7ZEL2_9HYPO|nr:major facilitator superfamily domain-containing protein [Emericellopsis atlantica]KAG9250714.1 major facilitator superfamily domain-containing protein [Emericellopsis atlantica]